MTDFRDIEEEIPMTAIATDVVNVKNELKEEMCEEDNQNIEVRYEIYDQTEEETSYNCEACGITFTSIEDHIRDCHADEDIIVKIQGDEDDDVNVGDDLEEMVEFDPDREIKEEPGEDDNLDIIMNDETEIIDDDDEDLYETEYLDDDEDTDVYLDNGTDTSSKTTESNSFKLLDPLNLEQCVDKDGRPFNRKLVKINVFWDDKEEKTETVVPTSVKIETPSLAPKKVKNTVLRTKTNSVYKCDQCDIVFSTARSYSTHTKMHRVDTNDTGDCQVVESKDKFECEICHTVFGSNKSMRLHSRMHDPIKPRLIDQSLTADGASGLCEYFHCEICNKNYEKQFEVIHMRMHSDEPNYHCTICNKIFNSLINLEMHVNAHQEIKLPPRASDEGGIGLPYKCSFCGRQFSRPHEKVKHERIHTGEKPHICEICGKSFRVSYCLTLHMRTHTGARPYACPYCNKRFKAQSVYNHHLMTHSDLRPYQCPFCPKAFKTSVQLAGHKNSHTKPFSCSECNRPFATLYAVRGHMETHKKPNHNLKHKCRVCGATYARSFALRDHVKEQHSDVYENGELIDIITIPDIHEDTDKSILPDTQIFSLAVDHEDIENETTDGIIIDEFEKEEIVADWILPKK